MRQSDNQDSRRTDGHDHHIPGHHQLLSQTVWVRVGIDIGIFAAKTHFKSSIINLCEELISIYVIPHISFISEQCNIWCVHVSSKTSCNSYCHVVCSKIILSLQLDTATGHPRFAASLAHWVCWVNCHCSCYCNRNTLITWITWFRIAIGRDLGDV